MKNFKLFDFCGFDFADVFKIAIVERILTLTTY